MGFIKLWFCDWCKKEVPDGSHLIDIEDEYICNECADLDRKAIVEVRKEIRSKLIDAQAPTPENLHKSWLEKFGNKGK